MKPLLENHPIKNFFAKFCELFLSFETHSLILLAGCLYTLNDLALVFESLIVCFNIQCMLQLLFRCLISCSCD